MPRPTKKAKLELYDDGDSDAGVPLASNGAGFTINTDFAKRFEHNKQREEKQRLEEKYGKKRKRNGKADDEDEDEDESEESSSDESEDDDAELVTEELDEEWMATIRALKERDPRRLDPNTQFFKEFDPEAPVRTRTEKDTPMTLHDYQREKLLAGQEEEEEEEPVQTYTEEQEQLKRELVGSMHIAKQEDDDDSEEEDFMVAKKKPKHDQLPKLPAKRITDDEVKAADKDPETYLSDFMASQAWRPGGAARFQPLESDDSDDDERADKFEEAYNIRFEDPNKANAILQAYSRDVGKYSARRDDMTGRAKIRAHKRELKDAVKQEREADLARLKKLRVDEIEKRVKEIKKAAGLKGKELDLDRWRGVLDGDFDDAKWEAEMKRRFGEEYYAEGDGDAASSGEEERSNGKRRKPKKPKWDDDIDVADIAPDLDDEKPNNIFTDEEEEEGGTLLPQSEDDEDESLSRKKKPSKKDRAKEKADAKRAARKERMKIEEMVEAELPLHHPALTQASTSSVPVTGFRYRETSPTTFGLSARDILFADDSALNQYAGLKKMAAFRDDEKKKRDKKKFSKKARLRQWRKETFGDVEEPQGGFERVLGGQNGFVGTGANADVVMGGSTGGDENVVEGKRKKKRKGKKAKAVGVVE